MVAKKKPKKRKRRIPLNAARKKAMIAALESTLGIITHAAKIVGIDRKTHDRWLETDEDYKQKVIALQDIKRDFVESSLMQLVKSGDTASTIFCAKVLLKKRGYVEKEAGIPDDEEKTESVVQLSNGRTLRL